jgi:hypothetical protein
MRGIELLYVNGLRIPEWLSKVAFSESCLGAAPGSFLDFPSSSLITLRSPILPPIASHPSSFPQLHAVTSDSAGIAIFFCKKANICIDLCLEQVFCV